MRSTACVSETSPINPEIVFEIRAADGVRAAEPLSFRNDFTGTHQEVYRYSAQGRRTHLVPSLKKELRSFAPQLRPHVVPEPPRAGLLRRRGRTRAARLRPAARAPR
jgi:hypothetical protein